MTARITRKSFLRLAGLSASLILVGNSRADESEITLDMVFNDPDLPASGNPKGDLTIVDFFDYNCPYCKDGKRALDEAVRKDGNIRMMYRDLPILSPTSTFGAPPVAGGCHARRHYRPYCSVGMQVVRVSLSAHWSAFCRSRQHFPT